MDLMELAPHIWKAIVESNAFNFIIFVTLFALLFKKIDFHGILESLRQKIVDIIEAAQKAKEDSELHLRHVEKEVETLPEIINSIIQDAQNSASVIEKKLISEADKQVENIKANTQKIINAEEKILSAMLCKKTSKASVELAKSHICSLLEKNPKFHEKYINESIEELDRLNF